MPTFRKDDGTVANLIAILQSRYECYQEHKDARLQIDVVLAFADRDEDSGDKLNDALSKNSRRCLGIARVIGKKDRAMGRGDAEIALDGDHWETITDDEQLALLDHELYHIVLKRDTDGNVKKDDLRRPMVRMRPHDEEFGWFRVIAARHGSNSEEQKQAKRMFEEAGQYYFPEILGAGDGGALAKSVAKLRRAAGKGGGFTISNGGNSVRIEGDDAPNGS